MDRFVGGAESLDAMTAEVMGRMFHMFLGPAQRRRCRRNVGLVGRCGRSCDECKRKDQRCKSQETEKLGVTQAYLSMLERGRRSMPYDLARLAVDTLHASPTAHPLRTQ